MPPGMKKKKKLIVYVKKLIEKIIYGVYRRTAAQMSHKHGSNHSHNSKDINK